MNILHLIIDDKFFDFIFKTFQTVEEVNNKYVAIVGEGVTDFKHLSVVPLWRSVSVEYANTPAFMEDMEWCDVLIVHWWHPAAVASVVANVPESVIVVWSGWGGDYYDLLPAGGSGLYGESTKELLQQIQVATRSKWLRNSFHQMKAVLKGVLAKPKSQRLPDKNILIKRIDYFSAPIPDDYELLKASLGERFRAEYVQLNYGSVEETFMPGKREVSGSDILLGNSATATNNHLEILNMLSSIDIGDRKVIVPLSYGSQKYGDEIEKHGRRLLGNKFVPIRNFMPLDEYNLLISSCSIAIMNHRRQQALGNIGAILFNGAKLFLDEDNVVYKFFKRKGAFVFSVRDIADRGAEVLSPLSKSEMERNIDVINQVWGQKTVIDNVRKFVDRMRKHMVTHA
jgi:dTDP-N-acetylfucosamine:lipid II N-acetylfucosaminyltransferase